MIGVFRRELRGLAPKGGTLFHTLIDEVDAVAVLTFHTFE